MVNWAIRFVVIPARLAGAMAPICALLKVSALAPRAAISLLLRALTALPRAANWPVDSATKSLLGIACRSVGLSPARAAGVSGAITAVLRAFTWVVLSAAICAELSPGAPCADTAASCVTFMLANAVGVNPAMASDPIAAISAVLSTLMSAVFRPAVLLPSSANSALVN